MPSLAATMKTRKGCWTCKARRVQCDGGLPACQKCTRVRRECQGYEMRLSWPRANDKRRASTVDSQPMTIFPGQRTNHCFINTTWWDLELHRHLSLHTHPFPLVQPRPYQWKLSRPRVNHGDLVNYCSKLVHSSAYLSLVTFSATNAQLRDVLIHMAMKHDTTAGLALFYALHSFSSLHRNGLHQQAVQLKIAALQSLSASTKEGLQNPAEAAQHVAASMLLGAFEILLPVEDSGEWLPYVWGAVDIIQATSLQNQSQESYIGHLLDWVYYHEALSRFPTHHWRHKSLNKQPTDPKYLTFRDLQTSLLARHRPAPPTPNPAYAILNLLSETCDTLLDPRDPRSRHEEYHDRLRALEGRTRDIPIITASAARMGIDTTGSVEIYQMATRIYLLRASQSPMESSTGPDLDSLIDKAFDMREKATHDCPHFFPLFILACEARTDERRAYILNLIDRTGQGGRMRSMKSLRQVIQSTWIQQDLYADSDLLVNYLGIMSAVISSSSTPPSFV